MSAHDDHVPWPEPASDAALPVVAPTFSLPQSVHPIEDASLLLENHDDSPAMTLAEERSFYLIDWANSVYSTVGISGFLPLLIQSSAQTAAGFPGQCPNVLMNNSTTNSTVISWPFPLRPTVFFRIDGAGPRPCDSLDAPSCWEGFCSGLPATVLDCRDILGKEIHTLRTPGASSSSWDPTSFATFCITASVVAQAFVFIFGGALADYGSARKTLLVSASFVGALSCVAALLISPSTYLMGLPVAIISNACFGITGVMMNAYLPLLSAAHPSVRKLTLTSPQRRSAIEARVTEMSAYGFSFGYIAGVIGIILCVPLILALPEIVAYQATLVVAGVWWAIFMIPVAKIIHTRPGPPLPITAGGGICSSYIYASLNGIMNTATLLYKLPTTGAFLLLWGLFSDAVFVVGTLGGLYANSRIDWGCTPKSQGVLAIFALTPLAAALGNFTWLRLSQYFNVKPEHALAFTLVAIGSIIPAIGLSGSLTSGPVLVGIAIWWGFNMGAMQAFSRAVFSSLVPQGYESACFSLFEITNRGSSWLGPLILTLSAEMTGDFKWGFAYVLVGTFIGAIGILRLDMKGGREAAANHSTLL